MNSNQLYQRALEFASTRHSGQIRKFNGQPYVTHPIRVAEMVGEFVFTQEVAAAALLHDTVEDTATTLEEINQLFGPVVAKLVEELTTDKQVCRSMGKTEHLCQKVLGMSPNALLIKLADRCDNVADIGLTSDTEWSKKYHDQTREIIDHILLRYPVLNSFHMCIISRINEILSSWRESNGF